MASRRNNSVNNNNSTVTPNETHLGFIQSTITRMGQNSFQAKAWCITVVTALQAYVLEKEEIRLKCYIISIIVTILFCLMDSYYLYLERGYRDLYEIAAGLKSDISVDSYSMSIPENSRGKKRFVRALFSFSTGAFYGCIFIGLVLVYCWH